MAAYAAPPDVDLVALAGMEAGPLAELGDHYGIAPEHRYHDWQHLVDHGELDVVSVATPTTLHAPIAVAALDAGLHVLSEKPIAENAPTAERMVEAAERNDRVLDVSFNHRRRGEVQVLKKIIDDGVLGPIYYAKAGWLRREGIPGLGSWFTRRSTVRRRTADGHRRAHARHGAARDRRAEGDRGHRGDVRRVRAARSGQLGGVDHAQDRRPGGGVRRRGPVDGVPPAGRRRHAVAGVELGPVDPEGPVLRHGLRRRRRRQHRMGRTGRSRTGPWRSGPSRRDCRPPCTRWCRPTATTRPASWTSSTRCGPATTRTTAAVRRWPGRPWSTRATPQQRRAPKSPSDSLIRHTCHNIISTLLACRA